MAAYSFDSDAPCDSEYKSFISLAAATGGRRGRRARRVTCERTEGTTVSNGEEGSGEEGSGEEAGSSRDSECERRRGEGGRMCMRMSSVALRIEGILRWVRVCVLGVADNAEVSLTADRDTTSFPLSLSLSLPRSCNGMPSSSESNESMAVPTRW